MASWLSRFQADAILDAAKAGRRSVDVSLDLGMTTSSVSLDAESVIFPDGQRLALGILEKIANDPVCAMVEEGEAYRLQFFRPETNRVYRLVSISPQSPPTAELGGFRMHRTKGVDPMMDTESKIAAIRPVKGRVLDTCTGLGYTAIAALKAGADEVVTIEVDEGMVRLREVNPWSKGLDDDRIVKMFGDVLTEVGLFDDGFFGAAIHDPPSMNIAGELYSLGFYRQLRRVLGEGGRLFHYVGAPRTKYRGRNPVAGVIRRLREAGFADVRKLPEALGVAASA